MSILCRKASSRAGFTFIEVLVAVALLVIGFLGLYSSFHASALLRETANETNAAMFKLQTTVEYLFSLPFDDITTVLPQDAPIDITALMDSDTANDYWLNNESVTIFYEDPLADPLKFTVTVNWNSRTGSPRSKSVSSGRVR